MQSNKVPDFERDPNLVENTLNIEMWLCMNIKIYYTKTLKCVKIVMFDIINALIVIILDLHFEFWRFFLIVKNKYYVI